MCDGLQMGTAGASRSRKDNPSGYLPTAIGFNQHDILITGDKSMTLINGTNDGHSIPVAFTLKIRGGCDTYLKHDGKTGTAGKGPLIQVNKSATLGVTQDQYLFAPENLCLNDQGGGSDGR